MDALQLPNGYEIIVADDGSADKTYELAQSYVGRVQGGSECLRVLRLLPNRGAHARAKRSPPRPRRTFCELRVAEASRRGLSGGALACAGKGGAVREAAMCARGERLLMVDADGATEISDLAKLQVSAAHQRQLASARI